MKKSHFKSKKISLMVALVAVASVGFGCRKKETRQELKTLDSIVTGVNQLEQCKGSNALVDDNKLKINFDDPKSSKHYQTAADQDKMRTAVKDYLSALPTDVQKVFFEGFGGSVLISEKADRLCNAAKGLKQPDGAVGERTEGCFVFATDPKNQKSAILTVIHYPDARNIRYYGPQIFGYLYAQFFPRIASGSLGKAFDLKRDVTGDFQIHKKNLANFFLLDLVSAKIDLAPMANLLGKNAMKELQGSSDNEANLFDRLSLDISDSAARALRQEQVQDYFFAHAFQSMHCTASTLTTAQSKYKNSYNAFLSIDGAILDVSKSLLGKKVEQPVSAPASGQSALALGGGLGGNFMSMIMPMLGQGGGMGSGGLLSMFQSFGGQGGLGNMMNGSGVNNANYNNNYLPQQGFDPMQNMGGTSDPSQIFNMLAQAGADGGTCPGGCCNGGCCSGGNCSNCANGNCGGCSGGCCCNTYG
jgi:hypothetical protein